MYTREEAEGKRLKNPFDTVTEGVGINRITENFRVLLDAPGALAGAVKVTDAEAVAMSRFVAKHDGLFIGSSSAVNLVAAVRVAKKLGPGHRICTIACDSGLRHMSKFWNDEYLVAHGLQPPDGGNQDNRGSRDVDDKGEPMKQVLDLSFLEESNMVMPLVRGPEE
jgi:cysteine synthase A